MLNLRVGEVEDRGAVVAVEVEVGLLLRLLGERMRKTSLDSLPRPIPAPFFRRRKDGGEERSDAPWDSMLSRSCGIL